VRCDHQQGDRSRDCNGSKKTRLGSEPILCRRGLLEYHRSDRFVPKPLGELRSDRDLRLRKQNLAQHCFLQFSLCWFRVCGSGSLALRGTKAMRLWLCFAAFKEYGNQIDPLQDEHSPSRIGKDG